MNLVSLLMLPAIITLEVDENGWRFAVAGVALVVLICAIVYSSRKTQGLAPERSHSRRPPVSHRRPGG